MIVGGGAWLAVRSQAEARRADADRVASVALGVPTSSRRRPGRSTRRSWPRRIRPPSSGSRPRLPSPSPKVRSPGSATPAWRLGCGRSGVGPVRSREGASRCRTAGRPGGRRQVRTPARSAGTPTAGRRSWRLPVGVRGGRAAGRRRRGLLWRPPWTPSGRGCGQPCCGPSTAGPRSFNPARP